MLLEFNVLALSDFITTEKEINPCFDPLTTDTAYRVLAVFDHESQGSVNCGN